MVRPQVPPVLSRLHHLVDRATVHDNELVEELLEAALRVAAQTLTKPLGGVLHEDDITIEFPIT